MPVTAPPTATGKGQGAGPAGHRSQRGITYLIVLFLIALVGMGLAFLGTFWDTELKRGRERELLFIGEQFGVALKRYYDASPGVKEYPRRLEDLLDDRRHQTVRRHLRQIFADPLTGKRDWVLVMNGEQITAIHSRSKGVPFVHTGFPPDWVDQFSGASTYADWLFTPLVSRAGTVTAFTTQADDVTRAPGQPEATAPSPVLPTVRPRPVQRQLAPAG